jgi:hypothetical protein
LWGVRALLRIPEREIQAAVAAAGYPDAETARQIAGALLERRARIARAWLGHVNGADDFRVKEVAPGRWVLEFTDLALRYGLVQAEDAYYAMTLRLPDAGQTLGKQTRGGESLAFDLVPFLPPQYAHRLDARRYAIAELRAWDHTGRALAGSTRVHIYFDRDSGPRIVGIDRD